jgi:hypothetical protein
MSNVKSYTDKQLIERVESLPTFEGWKVGKYAIYVRSQEDEFDRFDDKCYTFDVKEDGKCPVFNRVFTVTTNAGAQGLKNYDKYNALGCAVLKSDVIVYESHKFGKHKGQYDAYRQAKGFPYFRDGDKDNAAEEIGKEYNDIIGANIHKAGTNSQLIGGWSVACLVFQRVRAFYDFMTWANKKPVTVAILKEF